MTTHRDVDDDLQECARALDEEEHQWKGRQIRYWLLAVLASVGSIVVVLAHAPTVLSIGVGLLIGYVLSQAQTAGRRRRRARFESARLRELERRKREAT